MGGVRFGRAFLAVEEMAVRAQGENQAQGIGQGKQNADFLTD
jgi:hypothetical protein